MLSSLLQQRSNLSSYCLGASLSHEEVGGLEPADHTEGPQGSASMADRKQRHRHCQSLCDVESLSRFPPFRSRDLPWPLSFWLFKRSPYPGAFFPHGCSAGAGCPGRARACHGPQPVAFSLLPSCLFSESSVPHKLLPGPGAFATLAFNLSVQVLMCLVTLLH